MVSKEVVKQEQDHVENELMNSIHTKKNLLREIAYWMKSIIISWNHSTAIEHFPPLV